MKARDRVHASFWLLDAPDSLVIQSRSNPDGYGLATFREDGSPEIKKRAAAAYEDEQFAFEAKHEESHNFVAHVRYAYPGGLTIENTHPFEQRGCVFAHNGYLGGLEAIESQLGDHAELVLGESDSERLFALITKEIEAHDGDVLEGIEAAVGWAAQELPLYSINFILATPTDLWALRYPETNQLLFLEREIGGHTGSRHLDAASRAGTVRVRSAALAEHPAVIVASENMDEHPGWRPLEPGELLHVDCGLEVTTRKVADLPPAHQLRLEDLHPRAAEAQLRPEHSRRADGA
jgi:predicted glutamine amidotransferase